MSPTFSSLSIYNYRVYFGGALVSNVGTWMGRVAQDWLVLTVLTDHDPVALGVVTGLQFAPMVLLAPWAGMIADRFAKRRILFATQSMLAVTSLLTGVLVVTGVVQLWHVYLLALLQGFATAVDNPARQTFVSEMVPRTSLANAVSLNSASFNAARIIGPGRGRAGHRRGRHRAGVLRQHVQLRRGAAGPDADEDRAAAPGATHARQGPDPRGPALRQGPPRHHPRSWCWSSSSARSA